MVRVNITDGGDTESIIAGAGTTRSSSVLPYRVEKVAAVRVKATTAWWQVEISSLGKRG